MNNPKLIQVLLRLSISSVFLYAAIASTLTPINWIGYIPQFVRDLAPTTLVLQGFSLFQVVLSLWVLSGWKTKYSASLAALTLLAIIGANYNQLDVLFRDIAIFFAALALVASDLYKTTKK